MSAERVDERYAGTAISLTPSKNFNGYKPRIDERVSRANVSNRAFSPKRGRLVQLIFIPVS
jgi:hypothetical protein